jgi:hypothetical protein
MKTRPFSVAGKSLFLALVLGLPVPPAGAQFADRTALFVVADAASPNTAETNILLRLQDMGFAVTTAGQNEVDDASAEGMSLVLVSATVSSGTVATNMPGLKDLPAPVMIWEPALFDDIGFQAAATGEFNSSVIVIVDAGHPLAAGLPAGETYIADADVAVSYGTPEGEAIVIAVNPNDSTQAVHFAYEKGAVMASGAAPARRVGTFLLNNVAETMNEDAWALFDSAVVWLMGPAAPSAVGGASTGNPARFALHGGYPNPFNPSTRIAFSIPSRERVRLSVWNSLGKKVAVLVDEIRPAGDYTAEFDASGLSTGVFLCRLEAGPDAVTKRMLHLK